MRTQSELQTLVIDSDWKLTDLYSFPHYYSQVYAFLYSLEVSEGKKRDFIAEVYVKYPWHRGFTALNFYTDLQRAMEREHVPMVRAIKYASEGFIKIDAVAFVANQIKKIVVAVCQTVEEIDKTYDRIYKRALKRKILRQDLREKQRQFSQDDIQFVRDSCEELAKLMGFESLAELHTRTGDPIASFKILLSFYRRVQELAEFHRTRKVKFELDELPKLQK